MATPTPPPRPLSSFIGRRIELEELSGLIKRSRLLTLTGPGGCGKTRLAVEMAAQAMGGFPDGIAYADLTPIRDPAAVPETVAVALGLSGQSTGMAAGAIAEARLLLLIDNAEHLIDPVAGFAQELLNRCPNLHVVVTSRQILDVIGEVSWRVPPLRHPVSPLSRGSVDLADVGSHDAIAFFCARAAEQLNEFRLTQENVRLVVRLSQSLDGIPLALELAAARVRSLALPEIVTRLDDSLELLSCGSRTAAHRHRTLRATLAWSYDLLDEPERRLLRRLAVFAGTFELEAVKTVCSGADLPRGEVTDVLHRLVDRSLVAVRPGVDGTPRHGLTEVVRQYAGERLPEGEEAQLRARHASYYAELVRRLDMDYDGDVRPRLERTSAEYDNVRLALDWAAVEDPELESAMADWLRWFWRLRGLFHEPLERFRSVLAKEPGDVRRRAALHAGIALMSQKIGDQSAALKHMEEAVAIAARIEDVGLSDLILESRALAYAAMGEYELGERDFVQAVERLRGRAPSVALVRCLNNVAMTRLQSGRLSDALSAVEEALSVETQVPVVREAFPHHRHTHGAVLLALDRVQEARDSFLHGLQVAREYENHEAADHLLRGLACVAAKAGQPAACLELLGAARSCWMAAGACDVQQMATPSTEAERQSRSALGDRAAAEAWSKGLRMDLAAALDRARMLDGISSAMPLTPRKQAIVRLVAAGLSNKEIAARLAISVRSVEAHLDQARSRLGFHNRAQLAAWAVSTGLAEAGAVAPPS